MKIKKALVSLGLVLSIAGAQLAAPQKANALIGLGTGFVPATVIGGLAVSAGAVSVAVMHDGSNMMRQFEALGWFVFVGIPGVLILEENSNEAAPQFKALNNQIISRAGLTRAEVAAYAGELEEINAVAEMLSIESVKLSATMNSDEATEVLAQQWSENLERFTPATQMAIKKIARANFAR